MSLYSAKILPDSRMPNTIKNRFYSFVKIPTEENGCMLWIGSLSNDGYGSLRIWNGNKIKSHRLSYMIFKGEIPSGMCACHACDNPACVNPDHLFLATHKQNMEDRDKKKRSHFFRENSHFKKGSPFKYAKTGEESTNAKLTKNNVIEIRNLLLSNIFQKEIAKKFNVTKAIISRINTGHAWRHVVTNHSFPIRKGKIKISGEQK